MGKNYQNIAVLLFLVVAVGIVAFFFNGSTRHTISGGALEQQFLQSHGMTEGEIRQENYGNSKTLFLENPQGQQVMTTYIKSLYQDNWKELWSFTEEHLSETTLRLPVNDHIFQYEMEYGRSTDGKLYVKPTGQQKPILAIELFSIGVIVSAAIIGRIAGIWIQNRKNL